MNNLFVFLFSAITISLTGVMSPGPITAATLAAGARHRHAGISMAFGHAVIELPLLFLLITGVGRFLQIEHVKITIGILGGAFLIILGIQLLRDARKAVVLASAEVRRNTLVTGILLTAGNPYFLLWWATVGLAVATQASQLGMLALVLFGIVHWLCDLVWLEILSQASYRGARVFSEKAQRIVLGFCGVALLFFAAKFLIDALSKLSLRV